MSTVVLGIDPGAKETGAVLRLGDRCYGHIVVTSTDVLTVVEELEEFREQVSDPVLVAVEGVEAPNAYHHGELRITNVKPILATAVVFGAVLAAFRYAVVVDPGKNGSAPLWAYPAELVGPREGRAGTGKLRHCRSAWDIAGTGLRIARMEARRKGATSAASQRPATLTR